MAAFGFMDLRVSPTSSCLDRSFKVDRLWQIHFGNISSGQIANGHCLEAFIPQHRSTQLTRNHSIRYKTSNRSIQKSGSAERHSISFYRSKNPVTYSPL